MAVAMIGPKFYAWDRNGKPLAFGKLYTYQARTNVPKATYQSEDQVVENTNPVILSGEGYANVYLSGSYKMVLKDSDDNEIWSSDPVSSAQADEWVNCLAAEYFSPDTFKLTGNHTDSYSAGRRVRIDNNTTEYSYSTIKSAVFSGGETTVTVTDAVVTTGIQEVCVSIVGPESRATDSVLNFPTVDDAKSSPLIKEGDTISTRERSVGNGGSAIFDVVLTSTVTPNDIDIIVSSVNPTISMVQRLNNIYVVGTVSKLKTVDLIPGQQVKTQGYYDGWASELEPQGGSLYVISDLEDVRSEKSDPAWTPDELGDHTLSNGFVAMKDNSGFKFNALQYGAKNKLSDGSFDSQPSIQAALNAATGSDGINGIAGEVFVPAGNYFIGSMISVPSTIRFYGAGRFNTSINIMAGFTDEYMLTDKGSAAKLQWEGMRLSASTDNTFLLSVVRLGYGIPFGTEGMIRDILIKGGPSYLDPYNGNGLNIVGNVGYIEAVTVEFCGAAFAEGPNSVSNSYVNCTNIGCTVSGWSVGTTARLYGCHVEAPTSSCVPFRVRNTASLTGCSVSLGNENISSVIEMAANSLGINVNGLTMLRSGSGTENHIINDLRSISSNNPFWADEATEQGSIYTFSDGGYIRTGRASWITEDANRSLQLVSTSEKGAVYTEMVHDGDAVRMSGSLNSLYPDPDNAISLGYASRRYSEVFAVNPTINTSDRNEKTDFTKIGENLKAAALEVKGNIQLFKWISAVEEKGVDARIHAGVIAQDVHAIFEKHGIDAFKYGIVGIDDVLEYTYDNDGVINGQEKVGERWNVRPTELIWLILSAI